MFENCQHHEIHQVGTAYEKIIIASISFNLHIHLNLLSNYISGSPNNNRFIFLLYCL